ncbi:MAG: right-handed parallel beta-helix repeat-containing protein [Fibrella sp.]|nr:right-handed parallel beta-helix repeat-containing protein [Armatimonadota bacterium]
MSDSQTGIYSNLRIGTYSDSGNEGMRACIEAGEGDGIMVKNLSAVEIMNIDVRGSGYTTSQGWGVCVMNDLPGAGRLGDIEIDNVTATGFRWAGIYIGGIPNDLPGFVAPDDCRFGVENSIIYRCEASNNMYYGIYVSGPLRHRMTEHANAAVAIINCKAYDNPGDKLYTANHSGSGILLDNCATGRVENCEAFRNGAENAGQTGGPCGIWSHASDRIAIAHCKSYENRTGGVADGTGFDLDGGVTNSVIEYCESWDNDGPGYLMWNYEHAPFTLSGNTIRDCVSTNDGRKHKYGSIHLGTSGDPIFDIYVRNCTITQSPSPTGGAPACLQIEGKQNENIVFRGNKLTTSGDIPETRFPDGATGITVAT